MADTEGLIHKEKNRQTPALYYPPVVPIEGPSGSRNEPGWRGTLQILQKNWVLSVAFALTVLIGVILLTALMTPTYEPQALLEIDPPGAEPFSLQNSQTSELGADRYMSTQLEILRSDELALATIRELHLDQKPELVAQSTLSKILGFVAHPFGPDDPRQASRTEAEERALRAFRDKFSAAQVRQSHLVEVNFTSRDPKRAAEVTNTAVDLFIKRNYQMRYGNTMQASEWVSHQLDALRQKIADSNRALVDFQNNNGIVNVTDAQNQTMNTVTQKVSELNRQLTQAEADRIEQQAYLKMAESGNTSSLPQVQNSPLLQNLKQRLGDSRAQLAQAMAIYGNKHPNVKKLQSEVNELEAQVDSEQQRLVKQLKTNYASARSREQLLNGAMNQMRGEVNNMNKKVVQYNFLRSEAQASEELYNTISTKLKEAGISAGVGSGSTLIIERARVLTSPTSPRRLQIIGAGLLLGLLGGLVLPFIRESLDDTIRSPEDVRNWTGLTTVARIPLVEVGSNGNGKLTLARRIFQLPERVGGNGHGSRLQLFLEKPRSPECEAVRNLHAAIRLTHPKKPLQVVLVASSAPREGKTTVAINLATVMAQHGKTCLIDADVRNPAVSRTLGISSREGLSEILNESAELETSLVNLPSIPDLTILPGGHATTNPGDLIAWKSMRDILKVLRYRFDNIVIDSPPIIPFADARALSTLVDAVILVGLCGSTTRQEIISSAEILEEIQAPILGVVLNAAESNTRYYDYYSRREA
jgi:succinoglycan biosynthesis transport protein ExoP